MPRAPKILAALAALAAAAPAAGAELLTNGDFEAKNAGFYSAYRYASDHNLWPEATFDTVRNPILTHSAFKSMADHTPNDAIGRMMVVNGAPTPDEIIWGEGDLGGGASLNAAAGSTFQFSFWLATVTAASPANLQLWVNGAKVQGVTFAALSGAANVGVWRQFGYSGIAGADGLRSIALSNNNLAPYGNDFALDDMSLIGTLYTPPPPPPVFEPPPPVFEPPAPVFEPPPPIFEPPPPLFEPPPVIAPPPPEEPPVVLSGPPEPPPSELATPGAVPEPAMWGLMILGFAALGARLRRRALPA